MKDKNNSRSLLVVEDSDDDAKLIETAFRKAGFANPFRVVGSPNEALLYLNAEGRFSDRARYPFPDLVLLDHKMPGDGWVVLEWVRRRAELSTLAVVIFSGSDDPDHHRKAMELGASAYHLKPSGFAQFIECVRQIAETWLEGK